MSTHLFDCVNCLDSILIGQDLNLGFEDHFGPFWTQRMEIFVTDVSFQFPLLLLGQVESSVADVGAVV